MKTLIKKRTTPKPYDEKVYLENPKLIEEAHEARNELGFRCFVLEQRLEREKQLHHKLELKLEAHKADHREKVAKLTGDHKEEVAKLEGRLQVASKNSTWAFWASIAVFVLGGLGTNLFIAGVSPMNSVYLIIGAVMILLAVAAEAPIFNLRTSEE